MLSSENPTPGNDDQVSGHGMWSSRMAFILAATGSAVGLGNIWRFPYVTAENGGGAFVLIYLVCIAAIGIPLLMSEILVGRAGRHSPINSLKQLAQRSQRTWRWMFVGVLGALIGWMILSFYSMVAGWTLAYGWHYLGEIFSSTTVALDPDGKFDDLLASPGALIFWLTLFVTLSVGIVALGVEKGLERAVRILMPMLFVLLLLMVGYGMASGFFQQTLSYLFTPDFSKVDGNTILQAMGQAFFSLSLGMTGIMAYGAYVPRDVNIGKTAGIIALADTGVALLAGMAIFPIVFAHGLSTGEGPGLIFVTLPYAFADIEFGNILGFSFFLLLAVAAWTSAISLMEPAVAYLSESKRFSRLSAAVTVGVATWVLALGSVFSMNIWSGYTIGGKNFQELIEYIASNLLLPLGGLATGLFVGWVLSRVIVREQLSELSDGQYQLWRFLVRYVGPVLVFVVFLSAAGVI